jgi:ankyrin repeat protein
MYLKERYKDPNEEINNEFIQACAFGDLNKVKYLLTSSDLKEKANIHYKDDDGLTNACENGHLNIVQYLLTSSELKEHIDLHSYSDLAFVIACEKGNLKLVKYLLTSLDLKTHSDIHNYSNYALREICKYGYLELLDYLTTSKEIEERFEKQDWNIGFLEACKQKQYEIISFFIYILEFEADASVLNFLQKNPNPIVEEMFKLRELNRDLKKNLPNKKEKNKEDKTKV